MSKKHQIIPIGFNLPFAAAIETLSLAVDDFGADCRKFAQEGHFTNLTSKISLFYMPRSCIFTNFEKGKKALSQAETPISNG